MSTYIDELCGVLSHDGDMIREKDKAYGGSWKKRGGTGAFMMLARKWDRLEQSVLAFGYDIFKAIEEDQRDESTIDDIRDLRRYLALVEAEILARAQYRAKERAVDNFRMPGTTAREILHEANTSFAGLTCSDDDPKFVIEEGYPEEGPSIGDAQ